jgi:hypothetical protein
MSACIKGFATSVLILLSAIAYSQSESHDLITYDTAINYVCPPGYSGCISNGVQQVWQVRITRPRNYFTPGNPDTASRPLIINMQGEGQTGSDTNNLIVYGPHFYMLNGWDGSVQLDNGLHYPLYITIMPDSQHVSPAFIQPLLDTLFKYFHPLKNSIHLMAFSGGVQSLGGYLWFQSTPGDEHNMSNIRSFVDLQGLDPSLNYGKSSIPYPNYWGYWAHKYGGRFWGLEGSDDDRFLWQISQNMNDSVPSSAYFAYEDVYYGMHCCWNDFYYPREQNWTDTLPYGNKYLTSNRNYPNTMGTYVHDPKWGANIYQWALRQGDTTLIAFGNPYFVAHAGANRIIYLPQDTVHLIGSVVDSSATVMSYAWTITSGTGATIASPTNDTTTITGLTPGTYIFKLTTTDSRNRTATSSVTVEVLPKISTYFIANAGPDRIIYTPQDSVHVNGYGVDSASKIRAYAWTITSGTGATIVSPASSGTAITGLTPGTYIVQLTLTDSLNRTATDTMSVQVDVKTISPYFVANAGPDRIIYTPQDSVHLNSYGIDSSARITSYSWTTVASTGAVIVSPSSPNTAIDDLTAGSYIFQLTLTDSLGRTATDTMSVQVYDTIVSPYFVANAGPNQVIFAPQSSVQVTGSGIDSAATITSYAWTETAGATAVITSPSSPTTTITGLTPGSYTFQLTLTDNHNRTAASSVTIRVTPQNSTYFVANAGSDRIIYSPQDSVLLTGLGVDSAASITSYSWTTIVGTGATIISPSSANTAVTGLIAGSYIFQLTLTDSLGRTATDTMSIQVYDTTASTYFVANAGPNRVIYSPQNSVQLTGVGVDSAATINSYAWTEIAGAPALIVSPSSPATTITGLTPGLYTFELTLTDSRNRTASDTMTVRVDDAVMNPYFTADAGPSRIIYTPQDSVEVLGSGIDSASTIMSYAWSMVSGTGAVIVSPSSPGTAIDNLAKGSYTFQLMLTDSLGRVSTSTMSVQVEDTTGAKTGSGPDPSDSTSTLLVYPNPTAGNELTIVFANNKLGKVDINIVNEQGDLLRSYQFQKQDQYFSQQLDASNFGKGIFFIQVTMQGYRAITRVIKW